MAKRFDLRHPDTHQALEEAILCVCSAADALLSLPAEEGALFHTLSIPGYGRVLAHESAIRSWFTAAYEEYAEFMAEHLLTRPEMVWSDILSLSVPFRPDRLCLTLALSPNQPSEPQGSPPRAHAYWNWSGSRETWDPSKPTACERRHHLVGEGPSLPGREKGHRIALAELLLCTVVQANKERLPTGHRPQVTLLETASLPVPAPPPEKRPNPVGRPRVGARPSDTEGQQAAAPFGDPRLVQAAHERRAETLQLPDGREVEIIDWSDLQYPFGRRVQSKVAALMRVEHLRGKVYWEEEEILERHRQRGKAIPGQEIKMMHFKTQFGRVTLNAKQLIWAYWTAEVPDLVRRRTYIASHVQGGLNSVYNMVAKGFKFGSLQEREAFLEAGHADKLKIWRDLQGNEALIVLRDRSYSKSISPDFKVKPGTPDHEIQKTRKLPALIGKLFANKVKRGELQAAEAYRRAKILCMDHRGWEDNEDLEVPLPQEQTAVREWLDRETSERAKMNEARLVANSSRASAGLLSIMKMNNIAEGAEDYSRFAEWWVRGDEKVSSILQEEFRVVLALAPEDYGVEPIDMEALADQRGRIPQ